jgi:PDZ domain
VRWALISLAVAASAHAAPVQSDPAFLGIGMQPSVNGGCVIGSVTPGAPAADVGMGAGDEIARIDHATIAGPKACDDVMRAITFHQPGEQIEIELVRGDQTIVVHPTLATRSQVLERRVGERIDASDLEDVDGRRWNLADPRGHSLIVGAFDTNCAGCSALVDRVAEKLSRRSPAAEVLAVVADSEHPDRPLAPGVIKSIHGAVPLAVADGKTYEALATTDDNRVFFYMIDCRGVVRLVAPIAPDADDIDAATDEVLAGAEQSEHARSRR